jgi:hypothetical protein
LSVILVSLVSRGSGQGSVRNLVVPYLGKGVVELVDKLRDGALGKNDFLIDGNGDVADVVGGDERDLAGLGPGDGDRRSCKETYPQVGVGGTPGAAVAGGKLVPLLEPYPVGTPVVQGMGVDLVSLLCRIVDKRTRWGDARNVIVALFLAARGTETGPGHAGCSFLGDD